MIGVSYALDRRIDLFLPQDLSPATESEFRLTRIVSYDNGTTWPDNWITNEVGVMTTPPAAAITGDSLDTYVMARGKDNRFWLCRLSEYYEIKNLGWGPVGSGIFKSKPAVCLSGNSKTAWKLTAPGSRETSYNEVKLKAFGQGMDNRIWWAYSGNGGQNWDMAWSPIGEGIFKDAPAAVCSADGKFIAVFGLGTDNRIWWAYSGNGGQKWDMAWSPIGEGVFVSAPAACCSWDGQHIHVFGLGNDYRVWQARSFNYGQDWNIAWRKINSKTFKDIKL